MMLIIFLILLPTLFSFWLYRRDRKYRESSLKDVLKPEQKAYLNLPDPEKKFEKLLKVKKENQN